RFGDRFDRAVQIFLAPHARIEDAARRDLAESEHGKLAQGTRVILRALELRSLNDPAQRSRPLTGRVRCSPETPSPRRLGVLTTHATSSPTSGNKRRAARPSTGDCARGGRSEW